LAQITNSRNQESDADVVLSRERARYLRCRMVIAWQHVRISSHLTTVDVSLPQSTAYSMPVMLSVSNNYWLFIPRRI